MPYRLRSPFTRARIGRRGVCLLVFGLVPAMIGVSFFAQPTSQAGRDRGIPALDDIAPASWWAWAWLVLGIVAMACALGGWRAIRIGFVIGYILPLIWGAANLISWLLGELVTGWISAVIYLGYSLLVTVISGWEEPTGPLDTGSLAEDSHDA